MWLADQRKRSEAWTKLATSSFSSPHVWHFTLTTQGVKPLRRQSVSWPTSRPVAGFTDPCVRVGESTLNQGMRLQRENAGCYRGNVNYGLAMIHTPETAHPGMLARKAEEIGFDSVWYGEHPVIPVEYKTPYPLTADGKVPPYYHRMGDPFILLAAASAVTSRIKLATGICLIAERNPLLLAKEVATLDHISEGRVILGIGAGLFPRGGGDHGSGLRHTLHEDARERGGDAAGVVRRTRRSTAGR